MASKCSLDQLSYPYITGSLIDYKEDLMGAKFTVENPNAASTCGCGSSFSFKRNSSSRVSQKAKAAASTYSIGIYLLVVLTAFLFSIREGASRIYFCPTTMYKNFSGFWHAR